MCRKLSNKNRQMNGKCSTFACLADHGQPATHRLDYPFGECQSETSAANVGTGYGGAAVEGFEDVRQCFTIDSNSLVLDCNPDLGSRFAIAGQIGRNANPSTVSAILYSIG